MEHSLSPARQRAIAALVAQQQQAVRAFQESFTDLAALYATDAGIDGECVFANDDKGEIVLREVEAKEEVDGASDS
jgi:hypothetical protein